MADFFIERNLSRDEKIVSSWGPGEQMSWHAYSAGKTLLLADGHFQLVTLLLFELFVY
jgi:hypothetical protein